MKLTIDRIEHDIVMAELPNGQIVSLPLLMFPDAMEGDIYCIEKEEQEIEERRKRINDKMSKLLNGKKGGDHK